MDPGTDVDEKLVKEISRIVEAGVVAGLDLVPLLLTKLLVQLKKMASMFTWIVPEEFYLPYPPSYCPQPVNSKKVTNMDELYFICLSLSDIRCHDVNCL